MARVNWDKFDFPAGCMLILPSQRELKKKANAKGGCCPYFLCSMVKENECLSGTDCGNRCKKYYDENQ